MTKISRMSSLIPSCTTRMFSKLSKNAEMMKINRKSNSKISKNASKQQKKRNRDN